MLRADRYLRIEITLVTQQKAQLCEVKSTAMADLEFSVRAYSVADIQLFIKIFLFRSLGQPQGEYNVKLRGTCYQLKGLYEKRGIYRLRLTFGKQRDSTKV